MEWLKNGNVRIGAFMLAVVSTLAVVVPIWGALGLPKVMYDHEVLALVEEERAQRVDADRNLRALLLDTRARSLDNTIARIRFTLLELETRKFQLQEEGRLVPDFLHTQIQEYTIKLEQTQRKLDQILNDIEE